MNLNPPINNPAARLPHFLSQWLKITQDPVIIAIVRGYQIDFITKPWQKHIPKTLLVGEKIPLMQQEIDKLIKKGGHSPLDFSPTGFYSRLFLVPKKGGSFRPVIDLSQLNKFIANEHFQMENLMCIKHLLNPNEYMVKLDLKDAYLTVSVHPNSQKFGIDTLSSPRITRFLDKLEHNEILPASGEGIESTNSVQVSNEGEPNLLTPSVSVSGVSRVLPPSCLGSPNALQTSTELLNQASCDEQWVVSGHGSPRPSSLAGAPVVDHQHQMGEWEPYTHQRLR